MHRVCPEDPNLHAPCPGVISIPAQADGGAANVNKASLVIVSPPEELKAMVTNRSSRRSSRSSKKPSTRQSAHFEHLIQTRSVKAHQAMRHRLCRRIVHSPLFDFFIGVVIVLNTSLVGIDQSYELQDRYPATMLAIESGFLLIYMAELAFRFGAFGVMDALTDRSTKLDVALLIMGVTFTWILSPSVLDAVPSAFSNVGILKAARFFRLARMVRLVVRFRSLWMLMQGLLNSVSTMLSVMVVLCAMLYMFACMGFDLIGKHPLLSDPDADEQFVETAEQHFSSLGSAMFTIFSFLVFDDIRQLYWPLVMQDPVLILYFLCLVFILGIVLSNLITAVMVNAALEQAADDRDAKALEVKKAREKRLVDTLELFDSLDDDGSGSITRDEAVLISERDESLLQGLANVRSFVELFDILDLDDSGEVDMYEFMSVMQEIADAPLRLEFRKLTRDLVNVTQLMSKQTQKVLDAVDDVSKRVDALSKTQDTSQRNSKVERGGSLLVDSEGALMRGSSKEDVASSTRRRRSTPTTHKSRLDPSVYDTLLEELTTHTEQILQAVRAEIPGHSPGSPDKRAAARTGSPQNCGAPTSSSTAGGRGVHCNSEPTFSKMSHASKNRCTAGDAQSACSAHLFRDSDADLAIVPIGESGEIPGA
eukprot:TRINITY_DN6733_c0_g1_i4.p1 TRINITY_DN6733_c0_g1~~TRINITY_DN6733_c0_g1_i4.p1  ORF type:complete len:650 (+),score=92.68 TRINITY_DN6733_c0_g1_i4:86-2035(+)